MTDRLFAFRWDVDHRYCVTDGIPPIREVCRDLRVPNTFFVNMGRSTNLALWLSGLGKTRAKLQDADAVHLIQKLGWPRFLLDTIWSRPVGLGFPRELKALQDEGHELGLHGGMDHVVWSRSFAAIPEDVLAADVTDSCERFTSLFGVLRASPRPASTRTSAWRGSWIASASRTTATASAAPRAGTARTGRSP